MFDLKPSFLSANRCSQLDVKEAPEVSTEHPQWAALDDEEEEQNGGGGGDSDVSEFTTDDDVEDDDD